MPELLKPRLKLRCMLVVVVLLFTQYRNALLIFGVLCRGAFCHLLNTFTVQGPPLRMHGGQNGMLSFLVILLPVHGPVRELHPWWVALV